MVDARPGGQVDGHGIGPVQADHALGGLRHVVRAMSGGQAVPAGQPGAALSEVDPGHDRILPLRELQTVEAHDVADARLHRPAPARLLEERLGDRPAGIGDPGQRREARQEGQQRAHARALV